MTDPLDEVVTVSKTNDDTGEPQTWPSPFLPGTNIQYAWDSTMLGDLKTCPRLYQLKHILGWAGKGESIHLRFGSEFHQALQEYDVSRSNGVQHEDAIHDVVGALLERIYDWDVDRNSKAGKYKNRDTIVSLVVDYLDHFGGSDPAQTYIKDDGAPAVELSFQFELDFGPEAGRKTFYETTGKPFEPDLSPGGTSYIDLKTGEGLKPVTHEQPYLICGHLDRVVTLSDQLLVMDRKTTTQTLGSYYFDQWAPHNQMTLYTLAGKVVLNAPIRGVCIDAAQILLEEPNRFVRGFTYRTQDQLDEWLTDVSLLLRQNEYYADADYWPMNDTACDKFGGCMFRNICSKSPSVRERFLAADFIRKPEDERWNPLKPR